MSIPIELDPREVLEHLQALGYHHISKDQLKQFIKDLKKLIKHDLKKIQGYESSQVENQAPPHHRATVHNAPLPASPGKSPRKVLGDINQAEKPYGDRQLKSTAVQTVVSAPKTEKTLKTTTAHCGPSRPMSQSSQSDSSSKSCTCRTTKCPCSKSSSKKPSSKKDPAPLKPVSSFIRVAPTDVRTTKTDPVTLYHYYQSLWARQNRPGENPHADVRWRIRHKMMASAAIKSCPEIKRENPPWVD